MRNEDEIVMKVARSVVGVGKWSWEIRHVDGIGALIQVMYMSGVRYMKFEEIVRVVKEIDGKVRLSMAQMAKGGLPIKLGVVGVGGSEVVSEDGKIMIYANVRLVWEGDGVVAWDDVEEAMMEEGLI
jgi:hypothetical protein